MMRNGNLEPQVRGIERFHPDRVILKSKYGKTAKLPVKFTDKIRPKTLLLHFTMQNQKLIHYLEMRQMSLS